MKEERIVIRASKEEKEAFEQSAQIAGVSLSAWIRERLRMMSANELGSAGLSTPFLNEFVKEFRSE